MFCSSCDFIESWEECFSISPQRRSGLLALKLLTYNIISGHDNWQQSWLLMFCPSTTPRWNVTWAHQTRTTSVFMRRQINVQFKVTPIPAVCMVDVPAPWRDFKRGKQPEQRNSLQSDVRCNQTVRGQRSDWYTSEHVVFFWLDLQFLFSHVFLFEEESLRCWLTNATIIVNQQPPPFHLSVTPWLSCT